jgi:hypothetical protein
MCLRALVRRPLRHRLRQHERVGGEAHLAGARRARRPGVGPRLEHQERPRAVGGRAAQHVEAYGAAGALVSRGDSDAEPALLAVFGAAVER